MTASPLTRRSMRNFIVRTLVGALFLAVMVCGIIFNETLFGCLFAIIMMQAMREFYDISLGESFKKQRTLALLSAVVFYLAVYANLVYGTDPRWMAAALLPLALIPVSCIFDREHSDFDRVSLVYSGLLYIALPVSLVPHLVVRDGFFDGTLLLSLFIIIWVSDVGAYCLGTLLGQKENSAKLAPSISPKKSWWGFWGGMILGTAAAVGLYFLTWMPYRLVHAIALGVIVSAGGVCGDLVESLWKRRYGVKDSGNCIPGHGGMLDRFDSSLIAIPLAAVYMIIFNLL